ncbi:MAG: hypothetical protein L6R39_007060 [Caloplaca ligustica]|nr:MAG: hypothetical protein L6R39_007060 [Caloplaca ligustica]
MPDDKTSPTPQEQHNTGFVSGNDWTTRWGNNFRLASGQMTEEGMRQMKEARDDRNAEADCARCEKQRDYLLSYSPIIRFMRQNINKVGADVHNENIRCRRCTTWQKGGFDKDFGIMLCANNLKDQGALEDTLAHGFKSSGRAIYGTPPVLKSELRPSAENADGFASSGLEANGRSRNNSRSA